MPLFPPTEVVNSDAVCYRFSMRKDVDAILASLPTREKLGVLPPKEVVRLYDVLVDLVMSLLVRLEAAFADVEKLRQENYKLQRRLNTNPGNSGVPPSQAPLDYRREESPPADPSADGTGASSEQNEKDGKAAEQAEKPDDGKDSENSQDSEDSGDSGKSRKTKVGARKGHPGHRQRFLTPDEERVLQPGPCSCGWYGV